MKPAQTSVYFSLRAVDEESGEINVIIETPQGSQNKYKYSPELGIFELSSVLPVGSLFPYDFGFIPSTLGEDGDPEDVMVLMDSPTFVGCRIKARLIGVLEATQTEGRKTEENDRLIAVASEARCYTHLRKISDVEMERLKEMEHFFVSYNALKGKVFKPNGFHGPNRAMKLLKKASKRFEKKVSKDGNG